MGGGISFSPCGASLSLISSLFSFLFNPGSAQLSSALSAPIRPGHMTDETSSEESIVDHGMFRLTLGQAPKAMWSSITFCLPHRLLFIRIDKTVESSLLPFPLYSSIIFVPSLFSFSLFFLVRVLVRVQMTAVASHPTLLPKYIPFSHRWPPPFILRSTLSLASVFWLRCRMD